jgi:hypothetical protein
VRSGEGSLGDRGRRTGAAAERSSSGSRGLSMGLLFFRFLVFPSQK